MSIPSRERPRFRVSAGEECSPTFLHRKIGWRELDACRIDHPSAYPALSEEAQSVTGKDFSLPGECP